MKNHQERFYLIFIRQNYKWNLIYDLTTIYRMEELRSSFGFTTFYDFLGSRFEQEEILKKFNDHLYCFMCPGL